MKYFVAGGAKLEPQVAKDFLTLGLDVLEGYGMTETAPMMAFTPGTSKALKTMKIMRALSSMSPLVGAILNI